MKKILITFIIAASLVMPGCAMFNKGTVSTQPKKITVWWGTKAEVKAFLDSPEAQSEKWFIQSLGD